MNRPSALSPRALFRLMAAVVVALLLMPLGIGCAGQAVAGPAPVMASHMDCEGKRPPAAPAHDCRSDCALACAALPTPPSPEARAMVAMSEPAQRVPVSLAHLVNGPAPPPPRG
ncbi:hypothetical protein [Sphingomonas yantingensis]|uniref:DUF2946 domain-containing protein n=1 Tax=Sphingomonas yantingensis TaxID=1241761 RepID=A0A7W9AP43_9SPHN|nr:hypothetical protein [Sphingomonas yantingensis]MBB5697851.1 hypothetical protein [Sphingomonas yantingensis]